MEIDEYKWNTTVPWEGLPLQDTDGGWGGVVYSFPRGSHLFPMKNDNLLVSADRMVGRNGIS